ncbi:uncharacterized protein LOC141525945 isoform X2 [Cotesia typhae]|uniref:uncharacterized protein LOC141525945 isoform X2 n=1 Tax=Cotesia typhae TaxID=2053667 RepID=UPI003D68A8AB
MPGDNNESGGESDNSNSSISRRRKNPQFKFSDIAQQRQPSKTGQKIIPLNKSGQLLKIVGIHPLSKNHPGSLKASGLPQKPTNTVQNNSELSQSPAELLQGSGEVKQRTLTDSHSSTEDHTQDGRVLRELLRVSQTNNSLLNELSRKVDDQGKKLDELSKTVRQRQNQLITGVKPDFIPFKTVTEVTEYEKATEDDRSLLRLYNRCTPALLCNYTMKQ